MSHVLSSRQLLQSPVKSALLFSSHLPKKLKYFQTADLPEFNARMSQKIHKTLLSESKRNNPLQD